MCAHHAGATSHKHDDFNGLDHYETQGLTLEPFAYKLMSRQSFLDFILLTIISNSQCGAALSISMNTFCANYSQLALTFVLGVDVLTCLFFFGPVWTLFVRSLYSFSFSLFFSFFFFFFYLFIYNHLAF